MEKYQTFFPRFVALLIDGFIMLPLAILDDWFRQAEFPPLFFYFWIPLSTLVAPVYMLLMHGFYGQTLGKMAMNVKVLDVTEEPITFAQATRREIPQLIFNGAAIYMGIVFLGQNPESEGVKSMTENLMRVSAIWGLADILTFAFSAKRRALHDLLAGTVVVKTNV
jgi:uncharacterized RDD family membrane protein YckC